MTIRLETVSRSFGEILALDDVTVHAPTGRITVLLGPNGAGKTTAIRLITGALAPDTGSVRVFDADPTGPEGEQIRRRCGVVTAKPSLYDRLSGTDNLRYAAELFGLPRGEPTEKRILEAAEQFGISDALALQVGGYSTGMKTRLALARAVLHHPDLLLLDEPTSGLDPESAAAVLDLIRDMTSDARTVLMCTHLLLEAEGLADRVVVMQHGTSVVSGEPDELAARFWPEPMVRLTAETGADLDSLADEPGVTAYDRSGDTAALTLDRSDRVGDLVLHLAGRGVRLRAVDPFRPTLEDLYFAVRGHDRAPSITADRDPVPRHADRPPPTDAAGAARDDQPSAPLAVGADR